ncbi:MAG: undecaprenyl-diphosphate phosphatase [Polyangiaceae bacterium]|nr:undecaprenyl-diphosphate phosphatase [Polyangiaceae bacterium]
MTPFEAFLLGVVEGVTEYLPVSSTGHLLLTSHFLGIPKELADTFDIVIQFGAILAVVVHYRTTLRDHGAGLLARRPASVRLLASLVLAFIPTVILGLTLRKVIKHYLFGPKPVLVAMLVGGVLMIVVEAWRRRSREAHPVTSLTDVTYKQAAAIGIGQCFSMFPGASRSMCTIVAGQLAGLSTETAAEFSFLLGLPTLGAASLYEAYKDRAALAEIGGLNVAIGVVVSFLVAWAVIAAFLKYLKRFGLAPFGVYRIVAAGVFFLFLVRAA